MNKILFTGALLGLLSILMAAYLDHSLAFTLNDKLLHSMLVAVRYHELYAIVITIIGLVVSLALNQRTKSWLILSAWFFVIGILLFSFSIYIAAMTGRVGLFHLAPIGGVSLMIGWISLLCTSLIKVN